MHSIIKEVSFLQKKLKECRKEFLDLNSRYYKKEGEKYKKYYREYLNIIKKDFQEAEIPYDNLFNIFHTNISEIEEKEFFYKYNKAVDEINLYAIDNKKTKYEKLTDRLYIYYLIVAIHVFIRLKKMSIPEEREIESYSDLVKEEKLLENNVYWYRGQGEYDWHLTPSYFRTLSGGRKIVDYDYLINDYVNMNIMNKISKVFNDNKVILDYERLSFIQHSLSNTPLIDFTKKMKVAATFAIGNLETPRRMIRSAAAIIRLKVNKEDIIYDIDTATNKIKNLKILNYVGKNTLHNFISTMLWVKYFIGNEKSRAYLIDIKTNDRMRIQDGTFVLFDNIVIINQRIYFINPKGFASLFSKYKIKAINRLAIHNDILKNDSRYHLNNLLNPYHFMKE